MPSDHSDDRPSHTHGDYSSIGHRVRVIVLHHTRATLALGPFPYKQFKTLQHRRSITLSLGLLALLNALAKLYRLPYQHSKRLLTVQSCISSSHVILNCKDI